MLNVNYYLRNLTKNIPQSIWAVFYIENTRFMISTNQFILPKDWSKDKKKALTSYREHIKLNNLLKEQSEFISSYVDKLKLKKKRFYKDELLEEFNRNFRIGENLPKKEGDVVDFISFIDKYIESRKDLAPGSVTILRGTRKHILIAFNLVSKKMLNRWEAMNKQQKSENLDFLQPTKQVDFNEINYNWMVEYNTYLLNATFTEKIRGVETIKHYSKNYIAKEIKTAKQFANSAVKAGYINSYSHKGLQSNWEDADSVYLNWDEIGKLKALDFEPNSISGKVRNLFVFNCYLGLRYSDLYKLDKNRFTTSQNQLFLTIRMKKVDEVVMQCWKNSKINVFQ